MSLERRPEGEHPRTRLSVAFELRGTPARGELDLTTPLGSLVAQARWSPGRASLVTTQGERGFDDLDALSREALGEVVPLAAMFDWLRGRPWPQAPSQPEAGGFAQLGWTVDTARLADAIVTARRAAAPAVTVRAVLDRG
ncbi:lipoprotein insertase outer membrane protein LolB [Piscinibacter sakaiensis]|uniref:lipoprotein insertase outer membrane protein LolB n=1 Tax=Piscinibacter sakaiensis TaxID=1547922 RepID=UPI003729AD11